MRKFRTEEELQNYYLSQKNKKINDLKFYYKTLTAKKLNDEGIFVEYEKKLERRIQRAERDFKTKSHQALMNRKRKQEGKEEHKYKKKQPTPAKARDKAKKRFCKYARAYWANNNGDVILANSGKKVRWNRCDGGHFFPCSKYPQLMFDIMNCVPISKQENRRQGDMVGERTEGLIQKIGNSEYQRIKKLSEDKAEKNRIRTAEEYRTLEEEYRTKFEELKAKKTL